MMVNCNHSASMQCPSHTGPTLYWTAQTYENPSNHWKPLFLSTWTPKTKNIIHKPINIEEEKNEHSCLATHKNWIKNMSAQHNNMKQLLKTTKARRDPTKERRSSPNFIINRNILISLYIPFHSTSI